MRLHLCQIMTTVFSAELQLQTESHDDCTNQKHAAIAEELAGGHCQLRKRRDLPIHQRWHWSDPLFTIFPRGSFSALLAPTEASFLSIRILQSSKDLDSIEIKISIFSQDFLESSETPLKFFGKFMKIHQNERSIQKRGRFNGPSGSSRRNMARHHMIRK